MCGIAGILRFDGEGVSAEILNRMADALAHRGPDGSGVWIDGALGLAHRRLAIIDLAAGAQPMIREDLKHAVIFNGEIYNYIELRAELVALGHKFRTGSDTEVLVVGYVAWGLDLLPKLRGMFSFAVWSMEQRKLLLVRDRLGKKPLSIVYLPGRYVAFASEVKALFAIPSIDRKADPGAIGTYLEWMYVPEQVKVWKDVERLQPGTWISFGPGGTSRGTYWRPKVGTTAKQSDFDSATRMVERELDRATRIRLRSDVPIGCFLSGGVDSSLVALTAAQALGGPLRTFSVRFKGTWDESPFARRVAQHIGAEHLELDLELDAPALVPKIARFFDEPFGDTSALPVLAMSWATKKYVTVVLSGDGGDEVFGGYDTYLRQLRAQNVARRLTGGEHVLGRGVASLRRWARQLPTPAARTFAWSVRRFRSRIDAVADAGSSDPVIRHAEMMRVAHWAAPMDMLRPLLSGAEIPRIEHIASQCPRVDSAIRAGMLFDQLVYLPGDILKKVDVASMSTGLEVRSPLLDDDLLDLSNSMPVEHHVLANTNLREEYWGKRILKKLCEEKMGSAFTYRRKSGFALPLQEWLGSSAFREVVSGGFASPASPIKSWFAPGLPGRVWSDFQSGKRWLAQEVWNLIMLDAWAREHRPNF